MLTLSTGAVNGPKVGGNHVRRNGNRSGRGTGNRVGDRGRHRKRLRDRDGRLIGLDFPFIRLAGYLGIVEIVFASTEFPIGNGHRRAFVDPPGCHCGQQRRRSGAVEDVGGCGERANHLKFANADHGLGPGASRGVHDECENGCRQRAHTGADSDRADHKRSVGGGENQLHSDARTRSGARRANCCRQVRVGGAVEND